MQDETTPQDDAAMSPASDGSVQPEQLDAIIEGLERIGELEAEVARLRLTDEERKVLAAARDYCRSTAGGYIAMDVPQQIDALLRRHGGER